MYGISTVFVIIAKETVVVGNLAYQFTGFFIICNIDRSLYSEAIQEG